MKPFHPTEFQIRRGESVREGILRITTSLKQHAITQASLPAAQQPDGVHRTRLSLKRARALVRLLEPTLGSKTCGPLNDRLRRTAQKLARARDTAVGINVLEQLAKRAPKADRPGLLHTRNTFAETFHDAGQTASGISNGLRLATTALAALSTVLTRSSWEQHGWTMLQTGLKKSYRRARRRFKEACRTPDDSALHAWRTAVKSLGYQLALLRGMGSRHLDRACKELEAIQSALGDANDLAILRKRLTGSPDTFGGESSVRKSVALLDARHRAHRKTSFKHGRRAFAHSASHFMEQLAADWKAWRNR